MNSIRKIGDIVEIGQTIQLYPSEKWIFLISLQRIYIMIGYSVPSKKSIEYPEKYPALKYDIISCHVPENRIYSGILYPMIYILYKTDFQSFQVVGIVSDM